MDAKSQGFSGVKVTGLYRGKKCIGVKVAKS